MSFKKFLVNKAHDLGFRVSRVGPYDIFDFEGFLYRHLLAHKKMSIVQIGANDGVLNDPIYKFNLANKNVISGLVVEPLPDIFKKLVVNYKPMSNVKPVNVAIHSTEKEMVLYRVDPTSEGASSHKFVSGIASFNSAHFKKTQVVTNERIIEVKVKCVSFTELLKENNISNVDLLLIDTEGYDAEIIYSIDFSKTKPKIIRFEHGVRNEIMTKEGFLDLCKYLNQNGYQIIAESYDATAYLLDIEDLIC